MTGQKSTTTEASEMTRDGTTSTSAKPSSTQHTSADVAPELFEP